MALIEEELVTKLEATSAIADLVADEAGNPKIYPGKTTVGRLPIIVYAKISTQRVRTFDGGTGLVRTRMQIVSWAQNYSAAFDIAYQVRLALANFRGTWGATQIEAVRLDNQQDMIAYKQFSSEIAGYGVRQDYIVRHREEIDDNT